MLQVQDQSLRPLTTAHLAQTMSLLVLSTQELRERVLAELDSNPALELIDQRVCPVCHRKLSGGNICPGCTQPGPSAGPIVFLSPRVSTWARGDTRRDEPFPEFEPAAPEDLPTYVLQQLAADLTPEQRAVAVYVLSSLDDEGFLQDPPAIIARATQASLSTVERVLHLIRHADPPGLATQGPRQALEAQLDLLDDGSSLPLIARSILREAFEELGRREHDLIATMLGLSAAQIRRASLFIQENLTPYPSRAFWGSGRQPAGADPNVYHAPDILISRNTADPEGPLMVEIFAPMAGWLRVNPLFREAQSGTSEDQSDEWARHLERAALFVKCLQQRNNTMRRLMEILARRQEDFILRGDRFLKPITRALLATELGVHESTVSRAVAHKAVALPDGRIVPLMRFFDRSLSVRDLIKQLVSEESRPLTDDELVSHLRRRGVSVARRTVAKYRAVEGILPARLRHRKREVAGLKV